MPWLAEIVGRLLWRSSRPGLAFVGAMLATGATVVGLWLTGARIRQSWQNRVTR